MSNMSNYYINKYADERGISRNTARLIAEYADNISDFEEMLDEYAKTGYFTIID